jgi:hypothetical protein
MIRTHLITKIASTIFASALFVLAWGCLQSANTKDIKYPYVPLMTEISPFAAGGGSAWIEFHNPLAKPVTASELRIVINDEYKYAFPPDLSPIPPKGFILLALDGEEGPEKKYRVKGRTTYLHFPWNLTKKMRGKPGQIAVYRKPEDKKSKLVGFVSWGAPGSKYSLTLERRRIWRSKWFVEIGQGSGDYNPKAIREANYVIGLYPGSRTAGLTDWVIYFPDQATPGRPNVVPPPSMFSPHNGAEVRSEGIAIGWIPNKHARKFRFQVAKDPSFDKDQIIEDIYIKIPIYRPSKSLPKGTYYYRVKVFDDAGLESDFSRVMQLIVRWIGEFKPVSSKKILNATHLLQRKDTDLLCLDKCASDQNSSTALHWDAEQPPPNIIAFILDPLNPDHGLGNCARASIAMMASVYGKSLSQDRIAYYTEEERSGIGDSIPEEDLAHFVGMDYSSVDGGAETAALAWAIGQPPIYMQSNPTFNQIKSWLDNNQPIMTRIPLLPIVGLGHVRVIDGYRIDSLNIKWVRVLDPLVWFPSPRWEAFTTWNSAASGTWVGPASAPGARGDEASIATDSDNDGIMDFDELKRFGTDPQKKDTDGDGKEDKEEIRGYIFNSANNYDYGNPDGNSNGVRKELDPNE